MADRFIEVPIETSSEPLADLALQRLQDEWAGWQPNDGDLEVVQIESLALIAEDLARAAARVPSAIFRAYGTNLMGVPYEAGTQAEGTLAFTLVDTAGYTIPAGTEVDVDGYAFSTTGDYVVNAGSSTATVTATSNDRDTDANGLTGTTVSLITALAFVVNVELQGVTSGAVDPETDRTYQDRLSRDLELQARTLVTLRDFELYALNEPGIGRALAQHVSPRTVRLTIADADGEVVPNLVKTNLAGELDAHRMANTTVLVEDPTYRTINVAYTAKAIPGYESADLLARISTALGQALSPARWGQPKVAGDAETLTTWILDNVVRHNKVLDVIADVEGVNYVASVTLTSTGLTADANGDITMPGNVALPRIGTVSGTIT